MIRFANVSKAYPGKICVARVDIPFAGGKHDLFGRAFRRGEKYLIEVDYGNGNAPMADKLV